MTLYKVLGPKGQATNGGNGEWFLPHGKKPGKWMPPIKGELIPCKNGYHLCRKQNLVQWVGPTIYEAECGTEIVESNDKVVVRKARLIRQLLNWNDRTARLFACDCAERAMKRYGNGEEQSLNTIRVARRFANGEATEKELHTAWDAAWDAAGASSWAASWAASWDAARDAAGAAAGAAAWAASRDAARDTAGDAARDTEYKWQTKRLFEYLEGKR